MAEKEYIFGSIRIRYNKDIYVDFRPEGNIQKDIETCNYLMALARAISGKENDGKRNPDQL